MAFHALRTALLPAKLLVGSAQLLALALVLAGAAGAAEGYDLRHDNEGRVLIWNTDRVSVVIDMQGAEAHFNDPDAVRAGFVTWTAFGVPMQVDFEVTDGTPAAHGRNAVRWQREDWTLGDEVVATTVTTYDRSSGFVLDSDIVMNAVDHTWTNSPDRSTSDYDVHNVVTHEAGHFFGMGHSDDVEATMYPTTPPGETRKRSLSEDDRAGIVALIEEIERRTDIRARQPVEPSAAGSEQAEQPPGAVTAREALGCAVSGAPSGLWGPLVVLFGLMVWLRIRRAGPVVVALLLLLVPESGGATVAAGLSVDQLADRAGVVAQVEVVSQRAVWQGQMLHTAYQLRVTSCLKGPCGAELTMMIPGGQDGPIGVHVDGVAHLRDRERAMVFGRSRAGSLRPVGLAQGLFRINGQLAVRDLRGLHLAVPSSGGRRLLQRGHLEHLPINRLAERVRARVSNWRALSKSRPR